MTSVPTPLPRSSLVTGLGGQGEGGKMAARGGGGGPGSASVDAGGKAAMVDSYLSSFNSMAVTTSPRLEDFDDDVFQDNVPALPHPLTLHKKGRAPPVPPAPKPSKDKPPLQNLAELPGLSIVTWEEFLETPSVLCGLFQADRHDFVRYNPEQVNVFFHDSRMDQPTLGSPSGDSLSWTIFIDSYNHLRSVRTWLTEKVSVILLQLLRPKGKGRAACLVAINPLNRAVGAELSDSFSRSIEAFLHHKNFSIELNLNSCVQRWCRTVLQMKCGVRGGRLVVTNAEESTPCSRVDNVPFCVLCFPVWGIRKLSYRFKRRSEYEDFFLYFKAEDLAFCTKSPKLKQYAEKNNNRRVGAGKEGGRRGKPWIKKNRKAVTAATQTLDCSPGPDNTTAAAAAMDIEEVEDDMEEGKSGRGREVEGEGRRRSRPSHVTSASSNTERIEPQASNGYPNYRLVQSTAAQKNDALQPEDKDAPLPLSGSKSNLLSVSTVSSSSCSLPNDRATLSSTDPTPRDGAHVRPVRQLYPGLMEEGDVGEEEENLDLPTPRTPRRGGEDPRAMGLDPVSTLPSVGSDDDEKGGNYRLMPDTPSPRPDTPFHRQLPPHARKLQRPRLVPDVIVDENEEAGSTCGEPAGEDRVQLKGSTTDHDLPPVPGTKQRISKVLRDMGGKAGASPSDGRSKPPLRGDEGGLYGRDNQAFVKDEAGDESFQQLKNIDKVKYTPIKGLKEKKNPGGKAFPYTSELMDFVGEKSKNKTSYSPAQHASKRSVEDSSSSKKPKKKSAVQKKAEDMLFAPRFILNEDHHDRNCLSDNDIVEDEFGDMEPDSVMSDVEGVASPRLIPVKKTDRTVSVNHVRSPRNEADTDWEIEDCELDDDSKRDGPKILAGARGAQQLRATSAQKSRESSATGDARRRGGIQNDSRRRYIALNSLRRKANQLALQAELRKQKRPDSADSARMEV